MYYMVQVYKSSLSNILPWWMSAQLTVEPKLLPAERTWVIRERSGIGVEVMCSWCIPAVMWTPGSQYSGLCNAPYIFHYTEAVIVFIVEHIIH